MTEDSELVTAHEFPAFGRAILAGIAVQLLWLVCCMGSYVIIAQTWQYQGFVVAARVDAAKLLVAALALVGLSLLLPRRLKGPADYVVTGLFDISFVPCCTYWALSNQPWWQEALIVSYWGFVLLVTRIPIHARTYYVKGAQDVMFLAARGLVLLGAILIVAGGHLTLRLALSDVYSVRAVWASEGSGLSTYLFPWLANALLPVLLAYAWRNRRFGELLILGFAAYMLFTSTGMKAYLFMPVLVAAVLVFAGRRPPSWMVPGGLSLFAGAMFLLDSVTGTNGWSSLGIRRVLLIPAQLTSVYLKFFTANPVTHLSDSILLRGWLLYPYPASVAEVIGKFLNEPSMNANTGLAADGFANFGVMGSLVWAVLLGLLIQLLRAATQDRESRPEAWAVAAMWPLVLVDSALTTSLLTHGLALGLLVAWSLSPRSPRGETVGLERGLETR